MARPLKNTQIGFRLTSANKADLEENSLKLAEAIGETHGVEDLTPAKITRHLVDAFNRTMKSGALPVFPFKLVTAPKGKTPPSQSKPKRKRSE